MSYEEFLIALTPYNYNVSKDNHNYMATNKDTINKVLHIADVDGNGQISFTEFFFFVLLMTSTDRTIKSEFKKTGGKMNMKQLVNSL